MKNIKHLSAALIALGLSAPILAQDTVYVPNQHAGFKVGVNTNYARENAINNLVDQDYSNGYHIQGGYLLENTGNDITVHYHYFNSDNSSSSFNERANVMFEASQECDLDTTDIELGQRLIANCLDMRLFAGVRYTELGHELGLDVLGGKSGDSLSFDTTFNGAGPRVGFDSRYCFCNGFGLDVHMESALLVGKIKSTYSQDNDFQLKNNVNRVVPSMDAKIGFDFTRPLRDKSCLVFEVGYETSHYFNVVDGSTLNAPGDASFNGAYADIKYLS